MLQSADVVIDTNVLVHANNPELDKFESATKFVKAILDSAVLICLDSGASASEAESASRILSEYWSHVRGRGLGSILLEAMLSRKLWTSVDISNLPQAYRKLFNQNIPDSTDRVFAKVASNSISKLLVSHDGHAFSDSCKKILATKCGISVQSCAEYLQVV